MERRIVIGAAVIFPWLILVGNNAARVLYVVADPNCVQASIDPNTVDFEFDRSLVQGALLPVVHATAGKFNRRGHYCDPEGDPVTLTLATAPAGMTLSFEANQTVVLAGELPAGVHVIVFHLVDAPTNAPPAAADVTLLVQVEPRANTAPVLY